MNLRDMEKNKGAPLELSYGVYLFLLDKAIALRDQGELSSDITADEILEAIRDIEFSFEAYRASKFWDGPVDKEPLKDPPHYAEDVGW